MRQIASAMIFIACGFSLYAQNVPKAEIFAGFSYADYELITLTEGSGSNSTVTNSPTTTNSSARLGLLGWNGSVTANINGWFGFTTDFSGNYSNSSTSITETQTITPSCAPTPCTPQTETIELVASQPRIHNFLFGPQFSYPGRKVRPFAHFLVGGSSKTVAEQETITLTPPNPVTVVGSALLGNATPDNLFAMALGGGIDYPIRKKLAWRFTADYLTDQGTHQNHVRAATGLVWRLGK